MTDRNRHDQEYEEALGVFPDNPVDLSDTEQGQPPGNPANPQVQAGAQALVPAQVGAQGTQQGQPPGNPATVPVQAGAQALTPAQVADQIIIEAQVIQADHPHNMEDAVEDLINRINAAKIAPEQTAPAKIKKRLELEEEELHKGKPLAVLPDAFQVTATEAKTQADWNNYRLWTRQTSRFVETIGDNPTPDQIEELKQYTRDLEKARKNVELNQARAQKSAEVKAQFREMLEMPDLTRTRPAGQFPDTRRLQGKQVRDNVRGFDPSIPKSCFKTTWKDLCRYGRENYFSEEDYIVGLQRVLGGEALETLDDFEDQKRPLQEIKEYFEDAYVPKVTRKSIMGTIHSFKRNPGETIKKCMDRFEPVILKLKKFHDGNLGTLEDVRKDKLHELVSPQTSAYLYRLEESHTEDHGLILRFTDMVKKAHDFEIQTGYPGSATANAIQARVNNVMPMEVDQDPFSKHRDGGHNSRRDSYKRRSDSSNGQRRSKSPYKPRSDSASSQKGKSPSRNYQGPKPGGQPQFGQHPRQKSHSRERNRSGSYHGNRERTPSQGSYPKNSERTPSQGRDTSNSSQNATKGQKPVSIVQQYTINSAEALQQCPHNSWHPKGMVCYCGTRPKPTGN